MISMQALDNFCRFFEQLAPSDIAHFDQIYANQAHFKDPFHDVDQLVDIQRIFSHMFSIAPDARFIIQQRFCHEQNAMIIWQMNLTLGQRSISIAGTSHLVFNDQGRVILHRDYWDTGEELFSKLPLIGAPTRWLMRQFSSLRES